MSITINEIYSNSWKYFRLLAKVRMLEPIVLDSDICTSSPRTRIRKGLKRHHPQELIERALT